MNGFDGIIKQLEGHKAAIEKALAALQELGGEVSGGFALAPTPTVIDKRSAGQRARWAARKLAEAVPAKATRKGGMTPEGKARLVAALKKRWAAKKAAQRTAATTAAPVNASRKGGISAAGRKALAEAMTRRWAAKRTAAQAKKGPGRPKKAA